jgi:hypothetical protein
MAQAIVSRPRDALSAAHADYRDLILLKAALCLDLGSDPARVSLLHEQLAIVLKAKGAEIAAALREPSHSFVDSIAESLGCTNSYISAMQYAGFNLLERLEGIARRVILDDLYEAIAVARFGRA